MSANLKQFPVPLCCFILKPFSNFVHRYFLAGVGIFVLGILVGWFIHTSSKRPTAPPPESLDLLEELLRGIKADKIDALQK